MLRSYALIICSIKGCRTANSIVPILLTGKILGEVPVMNAASAEPASSRVKLFSENDNTLFIQTGSEAFKIIALGFLLVGFQIIISSVYQAIGYPLRAMIVAISRQVILFIPLSFILTSLMGLSGLWVSFAISDAVAGLIGLGLLLYEMKEIEKRIPKNSLHDIPEYEPDLSATVS